MRGCTLTVQQEPSQTASRRRGPRRRAHNSRLSPTQARVSKQRNATTLSVRRSTGERSSAPQLPQNLSNLGVGLKEPQSPSTGPEPAQGQRLISMPGAFWKLPQRPWALEPAPQARYRRNASWSGPRHPREWTIARRSATEYRKPRCCAPKWAEAPQRATIHRAAQTAQSGLQRSRTRSRAPQCCFGHL